jgi:SlyX protein
MVHPADLAERVTELEVKIAYQDRLLGALDEVVRTFTQKIEALERELQEVRAGIKSPPPPLGPASEPPPHY